MTLSDYQTLLTDSTPVALFDRLIADLREQEEYHKLFDALIAQHKQRLGLSLARPATLDDVPAEQRKEVEETYVAAAREVGNLFLQQGDIPSAWMYHQIIREPEQVAEAIDKLPIAGEPDEKSDEIMNIALFQGANPTKGLAMMLHAQGTCSTITSLDQMLANLPSGQRSDCAKVMVRHLYDELLASLRRHVEEKVPLLPPKIGIRELLTGRDWIFEGGNYHVDVSHLNSVVRFARSIDDSSEELVLALELAEYGSHLEATLQYEGQPPFEDFYPAHIEFLKVLLDRDRDAALDYFRQKLDAEPDERDKPLLAYVLVDLLMRSGRRDEAVDVGAEYLLQVGEQTGFSIAELCEEAGRFDRWREIAEQQNDPVGYVSALVAAGKET